MELLLPACLVAAVGWAVWRLARPTAVFVIRVADGQTPTARGAVPDAFVDDVLAVFAEFGLTAGEVRGRPAGPHVRLDFSPEVPPAARQRLRNVWGVTR